MLHEEQHHRITARDLKEEIAKIPDDSSVVFMAAGTRCQFLSIAPSELFGVEGVFVVQLRLLNHYPPVAP